MPEAITTGNEPVILLEEDLDATEYSIGIDIDDNELILNMRNEWGVLSTFTTDAAGAYELAHRILRAYDKLEGL